MKLTLLAVFAILIRSVGQLKANNSWHIAALNSEGIPMKIKSLHIKNFRCFDDFKIQFDDQLTVLVGVNGAGKTAILDALACFLGSIVESSKPSVRIKKCNLQCSDLSLGASTQSIALTCEYALEINNTFSTDKTIITDSINLAFEPDTGVPGAFSLSYESDAMIRPFKGSMRKGGFILAFYQSSRLLPPINQTINLVSSEKIHSKAFENAFSPQIDFQACQEWLYRLRSAELEAAYKSGDITRKNPKLEAIRTAIVKALSVDGKKYIEPRMEGEGPVFTITREDNGLDYNINQLSAGYRTMLALVMDLARRMVEISDDVLGLKSPLHSKSIVLIDEVELHLHPSWQQTILPTLLEIFPETQFIVTTHSPQIITSIEPKHIVILKDGQQEPVGTTTFGAESSRVLEEVLGVNSRPKPQNNAAIQMLNEYLQYIDDGQWDTKEAMDYRKKLDEWLEGDPILDRADMMISRQRRLAAKQEETPNA